MRKFMLDFETTVYEGQKDTRVWVCAVTEIGDPNEEVILLHSIEETFKFAKELKQDAIFYYHNLKFDGSFWLDYLMKHTKFKQALLEIGEGENKTYKWKPTKDMHAKEFKYAISDRGQWYSITMKFAKHRVELRDSLKLLPYSIKRIGENFGVKRRKLEMDYEGYRYPGCEITEEEKPYIKNDVLVPSEALDIMFKEGHDKMTIGACCLSEFKKSLLNGREDYNLFFPNLVKEEAPSWARDNNSDAFFRKAYFGGWTYLNPKFKGYRVYGGSTADVNSLYPSMMHSRSGNRYPVGMPTYFKGRIPEEAKKNNRYYFVRLRTRFSLKKGKLPFIQIKGNPLYPGNKHLDTSDIYNKKEDKYYRFYTKDGNTYPAKVDLTLTMTEYELMKKHYWLAETEYIGGAYFNSEIGLFDNYINKYMKQKMESTGTRREMAKLFLNNLYGKLGASDISSFKIAYLKDGEIKFFTVEEHDKEPGFVPVGAAVTAYARRFTIEAAQRNYAHFIYADTDSIHVDISKEKIKGITIHDKDLCCWKIESEWDEGYFVRQKTYIEIEDGKWTFKCAGMPDKAKAIFRYACGQRKGFEIKDGKLKENGETVCKMNKDIEDFLSDPKAIEDFKVGIKVPGKLMSKRIDGGILLVESMYTMHPRLWE